MPRTPDQIVNAEVHYCVSALVAMLGQANYCADDSEALGEAKDQALELISPIDDWEEAAYQAGWRKVEHDPRPEWSHLGPCLYNADQERAWPIGDWQGAAEDVGVDEPYQREVFEHWIVSDWLADQLEARGEKVDKDFAGMVVWARTTSGQGIASDSVIEAIAADLNRAA